ncbi:hypothetical protein PR002_g29104 [Phytophthora rubi]|uniref:Uncharacterized protein n=1 Tax=Phytophthora rubi TaxID=129364 RepID=A0A6A3H4T8_9STRA|nr:hypothetical protein PR002_g29104 [Phytophthora rubi]
MEPYERAGFYETEEVYETEPSRERNSQYGSAEYQGYGGVYYAGPGYGPYGDYGGYGQPLEYEGYGEAYEEPRYHRGPSGFITRDGQNGMAERLCHDERLLRPSRAGLLRHASPKSK